MHSQDIASRMKDYFARQLACFAEMLSSLDALPERPDDAQLDRLAEHDRRYAQGMEILAREFWALRHEWEATTDIVDAERIEIRALAKEAEVSAERMMQRHEKIIEQLDDQRGRFRESWNEIRRGRDMLRKYDFRIDSQARFIDRQA